MDILSGTLTFISEHANDDVRKLALTAKRDDTVDLPFALDQIAGRQIARTKLPSWYAREGLVYPPHISMEQCSSEATSSYKVEVVKRVLGLAIPDAIRRDEAMLIDCTGGFGVDFSFIARAFRYSAYVERQAHLCDIARHNLPLLGLAEAKVLCADGEEVMHDVHSVAEEHPAVIFLDPARRDVNGRRTYAISDCTPDVLKFIDGMSRDCEAVVIKLSPMLDWHATVSDLCKACNDDVVREVHIVSAGNECKELLVVVSRRYSSPLRVFCVNGDSVFSFCPGEKTSLIGSNMPNSDSSINVPSMCESVGYTTVSSLQGVLPLDNEGAGRSEKAIEAGEESFLLVPNASIMKAGCFAAISASFPVSQVSDNSHLFLADEVVEDFPGKCFSIIAVTTMNKKDLKRKLSGIIQANISTRNFPLTPDELRKRLKLKDGGDIFIFATTNKSGEHLLFVCRG